MLELLSGSELAEIKEHLLLNIDVVVEIPEIPSYCDHSPSFLLDIVLSLPILHNIRSMQCLCSCILRCYFIAIVVVDIEH